MNVKFVHFGRIAETMLTDCSARNQVIAAAIATSISRTLSLPTSAITGGELDTYYLTTHFSAVANAVSEANEGVIFDTRYALDMTRKLWRIRVLNLHPEIIVPEANAFFSSYFAVSAELAEADHMFLHEHSAKILRLSNELSYLVREYFIPSESVQ